MINSYTTMETFKASDGNIIIYDFNCVHIFLKKTFEENFLKLSDEEKKETFYISQEYADLLKKLLDEPLGEDRGDIKEEYEYFISTPRTDVIGGSVYDIKAERLRLQKEWLESQNN